MQRAIHPAQAISGEAEMKHHEIIVRAPQDIALGNAPVIVQRSDEDFLDAVLEQFRNDAGRKALRQDRVAKLEVSAVYRFFQPIQRRFYVAMVEAVCDQPGYPRLDPAKVESAGMVLRKLGEKKQDGAQSYQGWMRAGGKLRGWVPVDNVGGDKVDPALLPRLASRATGVAQIDRALAPLRAERDDAILSEQVVPMFVAAPDICADAKRTLYYGLVQTTSSELAETPPELPYGDFAADSAKFRLHLVDYLRGGKVDFPLAGEIITPDWFGAFELGDAAALKNLPSKVFAVANQLSGDPAVVANANLLAVAQAVRNFILLVRQVAVEFDAFGEAKSKASQILYDQLNTILLPLKTGSDGRSRATTAGLFLQQASKVLLERDAATKPEMPVSWPSLDSNGQNQLANALWAAMASRFSAMQSKSGRFDDPGALYALCAFVRLKPEGACPAKIHWTEYTEPFAIAPWYESAGAVSPVQIPLPDLSDKQLLKSLKPNISFVVPEALQGLLGNKLKDLIKGDKKSEASGGIGWLCSFSIPIITICAFIVLNIFLSLFDLFFQWMLFFKICIPYPKK